MCAREREFAVLAWFGNSEISSAAQHRKRRQLAKCRLEEQQPAAPPKAVFFFNYSLWFWEERLIFF